MKNKRILSTLIIIGSINLSSCVLVPSNSNNTNSSNSNNNLISSIDSTYNESSTSNKEENITYTITWSNHDGSILEIDNEVKYGTIPSYEGILPTKESNGNIKYVFSGWSPSIDVVKENKTYTAIYNEIDINEKTPGIIPIKSSDNKTIEYGFYPQAHVSDQSLINALNTLEDSMSNGWYLYNGEYYVKEIAIVFNNEEHVFNDNVNIENGKTYWFKCETIKWDILEENNGSYTLLSKTLLDTHAYYDSYESRNIEDELIYANNYEYSNIREWLNNDFIDNAFIMSNAYIQEKYIGTNDKIYLLSYDDYFANDYGFDSNEGVISKTRECKTTDYARAKGAWYNTKTDLKYNGTYWTRSSSNDFSYCAWNVNSAGFLSEYAVDGNSHCVRPAITISL